ncbi:MAG: hypothetical protein QOF51_562 [Chloroflexota bacterium]|nr:hypothetical protein [Chloroflexota bacterium]
MAKLGVVLPQTEIGPDPVALRDYVQAAEALGYEDVTLLEHVLGAYTERADRQGRRWPYNWESNIHEPMVALGYLAALTTRLTLSTSIVILPQRQTVLFAKQAAEVDLLSAGRLRLGIGIGWNDVEYEALGESFKNRGRRVEEQFAVLRALWTEPVVDFKGRWHTIDAAGLNPLPVQRPIPLWLGGAQGTTDERVLTRIGRIADGWTLLGAYRPEVAERWEIVKRAARDAGRDPAKLGLQGGLQYREGTPESWQQMRSDWEEVGATVIVVGTTGAGLSPSGHIDAIRKDKEALDGK